MPISLYLDTNVYLSFFHLSGEDLEELEKLSALTKSKEIILFLPEQTRDEFIRNRDVKISDALARFNENKINKIFPQICKDYEQEYKQMCEAIKAYEKSKQAIQTKLQDDIRSNSLKADKVINELFKYAKHIPTTEKIFKRAERRFQLGNPPGKKNSYGDALNWESLVETADDWSDFYFISDDKDYYSEFDKEYFNSFLLAEWQREKISILHYYRKLSLFFKNKYPQINLASEYEKDNLISQLTSSGSFATSRSVIYKLAAYESFSSKQLNDIIYACINNNQIHWIGGDNDINENLYKLIKRHSGQVEPDLLAQFNDLIPEL